MHLSLLSFNFVERVDNLFYEFCNAIFQLQIASSEMVDSCVVMEGLVCWKLCAPKDIFPLHSAEKNYIIRPYDIFKLEVIPAKLYI